jgi:guanylate kinase
MIFDKIIITGKSASGKNYLFDKLSEIIPNFLVKQTTRPKRLGEKEGIDYKFIEKELFLERINSNEFITHQKFNINKETTWYYGISLNDFNESKLCILTPGEIKILKEKNLLENSCIVYLDIEREILENRIKKRKDLNDDMKRRLDSDDNDFLLFKDYTLKISNPNFKIKEVLDYIN